MRSNTVIIKYCLASVLTLTVFLSCLGCGGGTAAETDAGYLPESSPFSEEQNDEMMAYGFGLVSPDPDTNIVYDGEPVEVEYYIDNDSVPISTGMLMFVNGIPQPYSTDGDAEAYMHIHEAPANEKATVKIKFTPVCGREGDTLSVRFLSILNPQKRPDKKEYIFGHTNSITTFLPLYMEMKKDAPSEPAEFPRLDPQRDMTQNEADKYIYTDRRGREVNKLRLFELTLRNPEAATMPYLPVKDGSLIFEMHCCGGPSEEYIMIPFINGTPVTSSAFPCVLTVEEGTKVYENTFSLDVGGLDPQKYGIEEYNTFYMLAIPKSGDAEPQPTISGSFVFGDGASDTGTQHTPDTERETEADIKTEPVTDARPEWTLVDDDIFDISDLASGISKRISNILLEQRLIVCCEPGADEFLFIPFDLNGLSRDEGGSVTFRENSFNKYSAFGEYIMFQDAPGPGNKAARVYSLKSSSTLLDFTMSGSSVIGMGNDPGEVLLVDTEETRQRVYTKSAKDGSEHELFIWDTSDNTKTPTITRITRGEEGFAFVGWIYPARGKQSVDCCGFIDNNGKLAKLKIQDELYAEFFRGGFVIYDRDAIDGGWSGNFEVYSADTVTVKKVARDPEEKDAAGQLCVSENGRYILFGNSAFDDGFYTVYDTEKCALIAKFKCGASAPDPVRQMHSVSEKDRAFIATTQTKTGFVIYLFRF